MMHRNRTHPKPAAAKRKGTVLPASVPHAFLAVLGALLLGGCAGGGASPLEGLPRWDVSEVARITVAGDEAPLRFVEALTVDAEGRIYLAERGERTVRVLDRSGAVVARLGVDADGGLAMSVPQGLGWEGERLWVFDRARYQRNYFVGDRLVERVSYPGFSLPDWEFPFVPFRPLPAGEALAMPTVPQWVEGGRATVAYPVLRVGPGSEIRDTLWTEVAGRREVEVVWPGGGAPAAALQPFADDPVRTFSGSDGALIEIAHELEPEPRIVVERRARGGAVAYRVEFPFRPEPITVDEVERAIGHLAEGWAEVRPETFAEVRELFRAALHVPEVRPPTQAALVARDERVWIRLTPTAEEGGLGPVPPHALGVPPERLGGDGEGSRWLVLSATGVREGWVHLPPRFLPFWIDGSRIVGVVWAADEVFEIVELEVVPGA